MRYMRIDKNDVINGEGFRVVLWVSGCPHHCVGCHNPETWDWTKGQTFDDAAKAEIFSELQREEIDGITITGGEPLFFMNVEEISQLVKEIKLFFPNKTIWLYTGYTLDSLPDAARSMLSYLDVIVVGPFEIENKTYEKPWVGSSNQEVIRLSQD